MRFEEGMATILLVGMGIVEEGVGKGVKEARVDQMDQIEKVEQEEAELAQMFLKFL